MILFINTSKDNQLDVFLIKTDHIIARLVIKGNFKVSEKLLKAIDSLLNQNKIKTRQLKGLIVITGPGPFTSIRIGVAVANTLAYALKIPVVGLANRQGLTSEEKLIKLGLSKLKQVKANKYILPFYNKEPNIT